MSFVFLSHADLDKQKVRHVVDALIAAGIKVWLDAPAKMGFSKQQIDAYFHHLEAGGDFRQRIDKGLIEAGAVLVCWSEHAKGDRNVWLAEATVARAMQKLVPCRIDDVDPRSLPDGHGSAQIPDLRCDEPAPEHQAGFFTRKRVPRAPDKLATELALLVDAVKAKMQSASIRWHNQFESDPLEKLHYFVDRQPQINKFVEELCLELKRGEHSRACAFVVCCHQRELPQHLTHYIVSEAVEYVRAEFNLGPFFDWSPRNLIWPDCKTLRLRTKEDQWEECRRAICGAFGVGPVDYHMRRPDLFASLFSQALAKQRERVLLFDCPINTWKWTRRDRQLLQMLLAWWGTIPLTGMRTRPVLLIKLIEGSPNENWIRQSMYFWTVNAGRFAATLNDNSLSDKLKLVKLAPLDKVSLTDLGHWATLFESRRPRSRNADDFVSARLVRAAVDALMGRQNERWPLAKMSNCLNKLMTDRQYAHDVANGGQP